MPNYLSPVCSSNPIAIEEKLKILEAPFFFPIENVPSDATTFQEKIDACCKRELAGLAEDLESSQKAKALLDNWHFSLELSLKISAFAALMTTCIGLSILLSIPPGISAVIGCLSFCYLVYNLTSSHSAYLDKIARVFNQKLPDEPIYLGTHLDNPWSSSIMNPQLQSGIPWYKPDIIYVPHKPTESGLTEYVTNMLEKLEMRIKTINQVQQFSAQNSSRLYSEYMKVHNEYGGNNLTKIITDSTAQAQAS